MLTPFLLQAALALASPPGPSDWILLEDPDLRRLPSALEALPHAGRVAYESRDHASLLLVRHLEGLEIVDAIGQDEEAMASAGAFVPVSDQVVETDDGEAVILDCEWSTEGGSSALASTLYAARGDGGVVAMWLITGQELGFEAMAEHLLEVLPAHQDSLAPLGSEGAETYQAILHGHRIGLRLADPDSGIELRAAEEPVAADREFFDAVMDANKGFVSGIPRDWVDADDNLSVTLQIFQTDTGLGPKDPFVDWLAGQLQDWVRGDPVNGDAPIRGIHLPDAKTRIVSDEDLRRHYAANQRAPEDGVILKTYIPASPYARASRITFVDPDDEPERFQRAWFVELRSYPRSRTETVTRTCIAMLRARADDLAVLDRLDEALGFWSEPIAAPAPLAEIQ